MNNFLDKDPNDWESRKRTEENKLTEVENQTRTEENQRTQIENQRTRIDIQKRLEVRQLFKAQREEEEECLPYS